MKQCEASKPTRVDDGRKVARPSLGPHVVGQKVPYSTSGGKTAVRTARSVLAECDFTGAYCVRCGCVCARATTLALWAAVSA